MKTLRLMFALLACAGGAFAQESDAAKRALAREVIAASQVDKMLDAMTAQMKQMATQMLPLPADVTPEKRQQAEKFFGKVMDVSMASAKEMLTKVDGIYATVYTEAELKAMLAFYKSPEGQAMIAKQPQVMQQMMPLIQQMQRDLLPKLQQMAMEAKAEIEATPAAPPPAK